MDQGLTTVAGSSNVTQHRNLPDYAAKQYGIT